LDALAPLGSLAVTHDDKGREAWFELTLDRGLVEGARRIANLLGVVRAWRTAEVALDGDLLGRNELTGLLERLDHVRRCWLRRRQQGPEACRRSCRLGCDALRLRPSLEQLAYAGHPEALWFGVGRFDGERVIIDRQALRDQVAAERCAEVRLCSFFDPESVAARIDALPETVAADGKAWITLFSHKGKGKCTLAHTPRRWVSCCESQRSIPRLCTTTHSGCIGPPAGTHSTLASESASASTLLLRWTSSATPFLLKRASPDRGSRPMVARGEQTQKGARSAHQHRGASCSRPGAGPRSGTRGPRAPSALARPRPGRR